jgi:hypothetical protein
MASTGAGFKQIALSKNPLQGRQYRRRRRRRFNDESTMQDNVSEGRGHSTGQTKSNSIPVTFSNAEGVCVRKLSRLRTL